jgi:hypothetical protein
MPNFGSKRLMFWTLQSHPVHILVKDTIMFYELLKYEEQAIQATSIKIQGILHEITVPHSIFKLDIT